LAWQLTFDFAATMPIKLGNLSRTSNTLECIGRPSQSAPGTARGKEKAPQERGFVLTGDRAGWTAFASVPTGAVEPAASRSGINS
jgi:hypothetical protein